MKFLSLVAIVIATSASADAITLIPEKELNWKTTPEGVAFAALHGDRFSESYLAMVQLPAGTISPPHVKTSDMMGLLISGQMTHDAHPASAPPQTIDVGAYYHIPAGLPHVSACVSDTPCVTLLYQNGAFDFLPVAQ